MTTKTTDGLLRPANVRADSLVVREPIDGVRRFTARDALTTVDLVRGAQWSKPRRDHWQRNRPGMYFFASTRRHVSYESLEEHSLLLILDHSQTVAAILAQPFKLFFIRNGERLNHVPDDLSVHHDGEQCVWDVRPYDRIDGSLTRKAALTREFCRDAGFTYRVFDGISKITRGSLEFLHAYSDARRYAPDPAAAESLRDVFEGGSTLRLAISMLDASPREVRMWVYHMLWMRTLSFDHDRPLSDARVLEWQEA
ncbi:TnsA-like heteromeric transposase endonuclease subunit [Microbacterium profundi]|uniref:TnsA-like heteromeric transposase endonuclease subunit n=1 Tax=Microbacterium profundi TaxID=450380 RepID=UPI001362DE69|nr:TnsA-like heteromeric transposase endonuclease subunit [Microbacterium profundi]